ncbi:MAG: ECF transporter S component [Armatimonadota bacterium]|nr:ECF transporter S component [Armatimonadota bacterium]
MKTREVALTGLMAALVLVITRAFVLPIPQTKGFFNLGEAGVYLAAVLFGPRVGALAGGIGSALADLTLGYAQYAPFTLVIKGIEGALVGTIARGARAAWVPGLAVGAAAAVWLFSMEAFAIRIAAACLLVAALVGLALLARRPEGRAPARLAGMISGGLVMVAGYFTTQAYVLGLGAPVALVEVPYNLVQVVVGVVAGLAAVATVERALLAPPP